MIKRLVVLLSLLLVPMVSATEVFLVSDNPADYEGVVSIVKNLNVTNVTIVKTPWGVYNENVSNTILSLHPEKVIIVGGPMAVVDEYVEKLNSTGITVERIGGKDRYETNAKLILRFKNAIRNRVSLCICHGYDVSLNETVNTSTKPYLLILTNGVNLTLDPEKLNISLEDVNVVESPLYNSTCIVKKFEKRGLKVRIIKRPEIRRKLRTCMNINVSSTYNINRSTITAYNRYNHSDLMNCSNNSSMHENWIYTHHGYNHEQKENTNHVENGARKIPHVNREQ